MFKKVLIALAIFLLGVVGGLLLRTPHEVETIVQRDTTIVRDTIVEIMPAETRYETLRETILVEVRDTVTKHDTLYVRLPLEKREYRRDEFYAVVAGYEPRLIHMEVYPKTVYVTEVQKQIVRQKNYFSLGTEILYADMLHSYIYAEYERMLHENVCLSVRALHDIPTQSNGFSVGIKAQLGW